jgi:hypothetical protein
MTEEKLVDVEQKNLLLLMDQDFGKKHVYHIILVAVPDRTVNNDVDKTPNVEKTETGIVQKSKLQKRMLPTCRAIPTKIDRF